MIAVTGANGLLGSFIIRKLIDLRLPFVALKRTGSDTSLLADVADAITWREADVLDVIALEEALEGVTVVIHTAAIVSFNPRRAMEVMEHNVEGTRHVVDACLRRQIPRLVHISSIAALGRQKKQNIIDEHARWEESPLNSVYGESKYRSELEVFRGQEEGLSTVIVNPSVILAPADWQRSSAQLFKYIWDEKPFYTDGFINCVDVRDVADIVCRLMSSPISGERFIVNAGRMTFYDFFQAIASRFQKKAPSIKLGKTFLQIASRVETLRCRITGQEPLLTRETARLSGTDFQYPNTKIKKALSFEFQPIEATLDWCCQYYMTKRLS